jgi:hypothetical protein
VSSSPPPPSPGAAPGGQMVIGAGVTQPQAPRLARFLAKYFTAINHRDYPAYQRLYEPGTQPVTSAQAFHDSYHTTTDYRMALVGLSRMAPGGWVASVTFRSHQSVALSASHSACTDWDVKFFLPTPHRPYLLGTKPPGYPYHAVFSACS